MINPGKKSERCTRRKKLVLLKIFLSFPYGSAGEESGVQDPLKKGKATHSSILAWRIPRAV